MILKANEKNIMKAAELIKKGKVVAFPTETVYGLGANALNAKAIAKIFEIKQRPYFDPLIVHVDSLNMVNEIVKDIPEKARICMEKFWPGPLTIILKKNEVIPDIVTSGLETVAVRMPKNDFALQLINFAELPIAAPSANPFGYLSPTEAKHVDSQLGNKVPVILDGEKCEIGVESTIIKFDDDKVELLRFGGIAVDLIEKLLGEKIIIKRQTDDIESPGQLKYHYSPQTKIIILDEIENIDDSSDIGVLYYKYNNYTYKHAIVRYLSEDGNLEEAAANLFRILHEFDSMNLKKIYVEKVPEIGIGKAIMDRLIKAANKFKIND